MELVYAFLAIHAQANNGKITIVDAEFDAMQVASLPGMVPPFYVVMKFRIPPNELELPHNFNVEVSSPDGQRPPAQPPQPLAFVRSPRNPDGPANCFVIGMIATAFGTEGEYGIHVIGDGHEMISLPLLVSLPPQNA